MRSKGGSLFGCVFPLSGSHSKFLSRRSVSGWFLAGFSLIVLSLMLNQVSSLPVATATATLPFPTESTSFVETSQPPFQQPTVIVIFQTTTTTETTTALSTLISTSTAFSTTTSVSTLPVQFRNGTTSTTTGPVGRISYVDGCRIEEVEVVDVETGHSYWEVTIGPCLEARSSNPFSGFGGVIVGAVIGAAVGAGAVYVTLKRPKPPDPHPMAPLTPSAT